MRRLTALDRLILFGLGSFWLVCVVVHVDRQTSDLPLAWFPAYLEAASGPMDVPTVVALWPEAPLHAHGLQSGDRLLAIAGESLLGASRLDVITRAFPAAGGSGVVSFEIERDGERKQAVLPLWPVPAPWGQLPLSLTLGLTAVFVILQARGSRTARAYALAALMASLHFSSIYGGVPWMTASGLWLVILTGTLYPPLVVRATLLFPESAAPRSRWAMAWPWLLAATGPALYVWIFGAPSLGWYGFRALSLCSGATILAILSVLIRNYRRADVRGRRQMKWAIYGFFLGTVPVLAASLVAAARPELRGAYEASLVFQALIPLGMLVALVRDNLYDINRLITTTATYSLLAPLFLGALVQGAPPLAEWASAQTGLQASTMLWVVAIVVAAPLPTAARALRPWIERTLFREQFRAEHSLRDLRNRISGHENASDLLRVLGEELGDELQLETCAVYAIAGEAFVPVAARGRIIPPGFPAVGAAAALIAEAHDPVEEHTWRRWGRRGLLSEGDLASLETLGANVILPLFRGESLDGFVCVGDKLSGELFSRTELAILESLAERVSLELSTFDERAVDDEERRLYQELARYAPGTLVEEISRGVDVAPGEREVTVLFVDIRGYTQMSQKREAPEIFRVVNAYTTAVSQQIRDHGGAVVEFHGDGLMAAFGAPGELTDKERCAVEAARAVVKAVSLGDFGESGNAPLSVGVGVATGLAYVGDIQSVDRKIWGVIGNTTNLAARLEAQTRELGAEIVIDDVTHARAGDVAGDFESRDGIRLKGRDDAFTIWLKPLPSNPSRA